MKRAFAVVVMSAMLTGCFEGAASVSQDSSCVFTQTDDAIKQCKNGQVAVFLPMQWGNDQLPVAAASSFCDYRFQIVQNNGGVSCIFTDARLKEKQQEKK